MNYDLCDTWTLLCGLYALLRGYEPIVRLHYLVARAVTGYDTEQVVPSSDKCGRHQEGVVAQIHTMVSAASIPNPYKQ